MCQGRGRGEWLIQNGAGGYFRVNLADAAPNGSLQAECIFPSHGLAGGVPALATSPCCHLAVAGGADGQLQLLDYQKGSIVSSNSYSAGASCILWPEVGLLDPEGRLLVVGFQDGVVRWIRLCGDGLEVRPPLPP